MSEFPWSTKYNRHLPTCLSCHRKSVFNLTYPYPEEDEHLPSGSIIYWTNIQYKKTFYSKGSYTSKLVIVECGLCHKTRPVVVSNIRTPRKNKGIFTGLHYNCVQRAKAKYRDTRSDGYTFRYYYAFTDDEQKILKPMSDSRGRLLEHRAVMALHLGRSLSRKEIVHHIDSNRANNSISNLRLLAYNSPGNSHHIGHGDDYYQKYQECLSTISVLMFILESR